MAVLTSAAQCKDAVRWDAGVPEMRGMDRLVTDREIGDPASLAGKWVDPGSGPDTLAFLQYTSGSTAAPKGVKITHGNLVENSWRIQASFGTTTTARGVFWLPLFHDMGLIGGVLQTVYCGGSSTLFSPVSFLQRPALWLETISRTRATVSGGPNFAYDLCAARFAPKIAAIWISATGRWPSRARREFVPTRSSDSRKNSRCAGSGGNRFSHVTGWQRRR